MLASAQGQVCFINTAPHPNPAAMSWFRTILIIDVLEPKESQSKLQLSPDNTVSYQQGYALCNQLIPDRSSGADMIYF